MAWCLGSVPMTYASATSSIPVGHWLEFNITTPWYAGGEARSDGNWKAAVIDSTGLLGSAQVQQAPNCHRQAAGMRNPQVEPNPSRRPRGALLNDLNLANDSPIIPIVTSLIGGIREKVQSEPCSFSDQPVQPRQIPKTTSNDAPGASAATRLML
jgi:hypothetical protein